MSFYKPPGTFRLAHQTLYNSQRPNHMKIFIDGEWNSYRGDLISMALCAENGSDWYASLGCENPDPWVKENVMPVLHAVPVRFELFQRSLETFLGQFASVHIIADWPEDIAYFCNALITGPGTRLDTPPLTMEVIRVDTVSTIPHNALADAQALREWYLK